MAWIESHQSLLHHPKTRQLARSLGIPRVYVVGHLHCLWWWCMEYADDGLLHRFANDVIADACEWPGDPDALVQALCDAGFLDQSDAGYAIHDWHDYAGKLVQRRRANAERMRNARATHNDARATHVRCTCEATVPNQTVPNLTQPDSTEPEKPRPRARAREDEVATAVAVVVDTPYAVVEGFLAELGTPLDSVAPAWESKQRAIAKRLLEQGFGVDKVRRCARFMLSETWRESPFDLAGVEKTIGSWEARGCPEHAGDLKAQRKPHITDLSPAMQAIVSYRREDNHDFPHDLFGQDHDTPLLPPSPNGIAAGVVEAHGRVRPRASPGEG